MNFPPPGAVVPEGNVKFSGSVPDLADEERHTELPRIPLSPRDHQPRRLAVSRRCCMKTLRGWGGLACTSRDPPQEPHYRDEVEGPSHIQDEISRGELAGLQPGPRSPWQCDGVGVLGGDRRLDTPPERPAGRAAAVLGSRHRDRSEALLHESELARTDPGPQLLHRPMRYDIGRPSPVI